TCLIQAAKWTPQAGDAGEEIFLWNLAIAERQAGSHRSAQRPFSVNVPRLETRSSLFHQESANFFVFAFGPNHGNIGEGAIGDPHFFAVENVTASLFRRPRQHASGIGAELRLREAEGANRFPGAQTGKPLIFLRVAAKSEDRVHHQGALHGNEATQARIAPL